MRQAFYNPKTHGYANTYGDVAVCRRRKPSLQPTTTTLNKQQSSVMAADLPPAAIRYSRIDYRDPLVRLNQHLLDRLPVRPPEGGRDEGLFHRARRGRRYGLRDFALRVRLRSIWTYRLLLCLTVLSFTFMIGGLCIYLIDGDSLGWIVGLLMVPVTGCLYLMMERYLWDLDHDVLWSLRRHLILDDAVMREVRPLSAIERPLLVDNPCLAEFCRHERVRGVDIERIVVVSEEVVYDLLATHPIWTSVLKHQMMLEAPRKTSVNIPADMPDVLRDSAIYAAEFREHQFLDPSTSIGIRDSFFPSVPLRASGSESLE